jgi:hypothetical protein
MIESEDVYPVLAAAIECYSLITAMALDESIYDYIMYGESIGSEQYAQELSLCLQEQKVIEEILDGF